MSLLLLEVELMETQRVCVGWTEIRMFVASIIRSGINGNYRKSKSKSKQSASVIVASIIRSGINGNNETQCNQ